MQQIQKNQLDALLKDKETYLSYFAANKDNEAEIIYFNKKNKQFQDYLKEDFRLVLAPYYTLLTDSIKDASGAALERVSLAKDRSVGFTVSLADYKSFINFFEYLESDNFLKNFDELKLSSFSETSLKNSKYNLSLAGKLKEINANQN